MSQPKREAVPIPAEDPHVPIDVPVDATGVTPRMFLRCLYSLQAGYTPGPLTVEDQDLFGTTGPKVIARVGSEVVAFVLEHAAQRLSRCLSRGDQNGAKALMTLIETATTTLEERPALFTKAATAAIRGSIELATRLCDADNDDASSIDGLPMSRQPSLMMLVMRLHPRLLGALHSLTVRQS